MKYNKKVCQLLLVAIAFLVLPQKNWSDWLAGPGDWYGEHHLPAGDRLFVLVKNAGSAEVVNPAATPLGARTLSGGEVPDWLLQRGVPSSSYALLEVPSDASPIRWVGAEPFEAGRLTLSTPTEVRLSTAVLAVTALAFAYLGLAVAVYLSQRLSLLEGIEQERTPP